MDDKLDKVKVELFVPALNAGAVRAAIGQAGGGNIGHYSCCSFSSSGIGRFKPEEGANPTIGTVGNIEDVAEEKIEFVCDRKILNDVLDAIQKIHPYEEIGLFVYPIEMYGLYNKYKRSITRKKNNTMKDCIFCKIIAGQIESALIWENEKFLAILDVNPNMKGMALVLSKTHYDSYAFDMPEDVYSDFMLSAKFVAKILEVGLHVARVAMVMEGMGINHAHIKLYPLHGITEKFQEMWAKDRVCFEKYEGYLSTQLGPQADMVELKQLSEEIRLNGTPLK